MSLVTTEHLEEEKRNAHYQKMTHTPIPKLTITLAVPTIVSMLISSIYNMADTYFVSQLGTSAAGAVGIVFSLMAIIQAIGFTLGMGSGNIVSRQLGAKENSQAICTASTGFFTAIFLGILFCILGRIFITPLMYLLGSTETILPYAQSYGAYILLAAPVMCASFVMNNILRSEGKAALGMIGIVTGGILNIILDPIFIFALDLQTAGAAIATAVSQLVGFIILLIFFLRGKSNVRLKITKISKDFHVYLNIFTTGLPTLGRQGLASAATVFLNRGAAIYGDSAVAAMSITGRVFFFMFSAMLGFGQGFQPIAGFNYGAKKYDRVKEATMFTAIVGTVILSFISLACFTLAPWIIQAFRRDDLEVIRLGVFAFRAQCIVMPLFGITTTINMALQSTGRSFSATILAISRQGIFFLPLIWFLPMVFGITGVQLAQPVSDLLTAILSIFFFVRFIHILNQKIKDSIPTSSE